MDGLNEDGFYKKRKKAKKSDSSQFGFNLETKISQSNGSNSFVMEQDCNSLGRASQAYTKVKNLIVGESIQDMIRREEEALRRKKEETEEQIKIKRMETELAIQKEKRDSSLRMAVREETTYNEAYNLAASYSTPDQAAEYERKYGTGTNLRSHVIKKSWF